MHAHNRMNNGRRYADIGIVATIPSSELFMVQEISEHRIEMASQFAPQVELQRSA